MVEYINGRGITETEVFEVNIVDDAFNKEGLSDGESGTGCVSANVATKVAGSITLISENEGS